jgi:lipopolysaccharide/colanic/teichoic acid biosynthesis glycosyltransferase
MKITHIRYWILTIDLPWMLASLYVAIQLRYAAASGAACATESFPEYALMIFTASLVWSFLYFEMHLDGFQGGWNLPTIISRVMVAVAILIAFVLASAFLAQHYYSRLVLFYFACLFPAGLVGIRIALHSLFVSRFRKAGVHRCVILGQGPVAVELARKIALHPEMPFQVVGLLYPGDGEGSNGAFNGLSKSFTSVNTLQVLELLERQKVQRLVIAMPQPSGSGVRKLIDACRKAGMQIYVVPQWYDLYLSKAELVEIDGLPLLSLRERSSSAVDLAIKRGMDLLLSLGILTLLSPLLAFAALIVYGKKGKAFRTEPRCGKDGVPFRMWRLNVNRHAGNLPRYENLLVRWSLTELPQMWNVLRGDMSLVGPRPESTERLKFYSDWQRQRLRVRPGVTGLAQVHGLRDQHPSEEKARFDLQYIFHWSPLWDLTLILETVWTLSFRGLQSQQADFAKADSQSRRNDFVSREVANVNRT